MKKWLQEHAMTIILSLGSIILYLGWGHYKSQKIIEEDFPRLEKKMSEMADANERIISEFRADLNTKMAENLSTQEKRLSKVEGTVSTIRFNLVALMNKVGKIPSEAQLKELLAIADEYSQPRAKYFTEARLTKPGDELPADNKISGWKGVALNLGLDVPREEVAQGTTDPKDIQSLLTRSIVSEAAQWKIVNNTLVVDYKDGSVIYTPVAGLPPEKLQEMLYELNEASEAKSIKNWLKPQVVNKNKVSN